MRPVWVENDFISGVPVTTWSQQGLRGAPLVFYLHGFSAERSTGAQAALLLAQAGCLVVTLDADLHGERLDERVRDTFLRPMPDDIYPFESGLDRWWLILQLSDRTAADVSRLIDHYAADPRVDVNRVGACGFSMGGFATHLLAAREPRIRSAAALCSLANLAERWTDLLAEVAANPDWAESLALNPVESQRRLHWLPGMDPVKDLKSKYASRPLLMACGDLDTDVPKFYSVRLYQELAPLYAGHAEDLRLSVYPGIAHRTTSAMLFEASAWFTRTLCP